MIIDDGFLKFLFALRYLRTNEQDMSQLTDFTFEVRYRIKNGRMVFDFLRIHQKKGYEI